MNSPTPWIWRNVVLPILYGRALTDPCKIEEEEATQKLKVS